MRFPFFFLLTPPTAHLPTPLPDLSFSFTYTLRLLKDTRVTEDKVVYEETSFTTPTERSTSDFDTGPSVLTLRVLSDPSQPTDHYLLTGPTFCSPT